MNCASKRFKLVYVEVSEHCRGVNYRLVLKQDSVVNRDREQEGTKHATEVVHDGRSPTKAGTQAPMRVLGQGRGQT